MKKVILLIEDEQTPFLDIKKWLEKCNYLVLPKDYLEMADALKKGEIEEFVCQQIKDNRDLSLVLCDIKLGGDLKGGNKVIKKIRNNDELDSNYCSLLPIIAITNYARRQEAIISDGANYSIVKSYFKKKPNVIYTIFETHIERFKKHLKLFNYYKDNKKVFIVHGHNNALIFEVASFLKQIRLEPIILREQPNDGRTIIEKIENYSDVGYAIVLYTSCDEGKANEEDRMQPRARQNVVFEHGYMTAKLGRENVCVIFEDGVEEPGDMKGLVYIKYNNDWKNELVNNLKSRGFKINKNLIK